MLLTESNNFIDFFVCSVFCDCLDDVDVVVVVVVIVVFVVIFVDKFLCGRKKECKYCEVLV